MQLWILLEFIAFIFPIVHLIAQFNVIAVHKNFFLERVHFDF